MIEEKIEYKWYSGKYDLVFKEIMLKEKNRDLLKELLEHILKVEIYKIDIKKDDKIRKNIHIKGMRTDLSLETNIGYINVELNSNPYNYVHTRNFSYLADTYSHDILVGDKYNENKKYIQINLSYGFMLTENNKMKKNPIDTKAIRVYEMKDEEGKKFIENFIIYEINMDYYLWIWYNRDNKKLEKEKILIMLGLDKESLKELSINDKVVSKYMEEVDTVNKNPEFREYISYEEDQRKIRNTLLSEAMEEGINSRNIDIAKNLLRNNIETGIIINSTGLSEKEILALAKEINVEPQYREYISYEEDQRKIRNTLLSEAREEGIEQGINSRNIEIAKNMLKETNDLEFISRITNLSVDEINKINNNMN